MFSYWAKPEDALDLSMMLNDHIAACCASNPNRFAGLGTLPMQSPELACQELRRCVKDLGLAGVQIGSHVNARTLADPALFRVFQTGGACAPSCRCCPALLSSSHDSKSARC
jgi:aminocarboxymuconate-semialdehyde decarboxylase